MKYCEINGVKGVFDAFKSVDESNAGWSKSLRLLNKW